MPSKRRQSATTHKNEYEAGPRKSKRVKSNAPVRVTTRSMSLSATRYAVFCTTELLDDILLQLTMKDLLFAQRVCRRWRDVIQQSKPLQKALFFLPSDPDVHWKLVGTQDGTQKLARASKNEFNGQPSPDLFGTGILNPLLCRVASGSYQRQGNIDATRRSDILWLRGRPSDRYRNASWQRMYLVHAPAGEFEYYLEYTEDESCNWLNAICETFAYPPNGKMSDIMSSVEQVECEGSLPKWNGHVLTFPDILFMDPASFGR